jgi:hypothetical protein
MKRPKLKTVLRTVAGLAVLAGLYFVFVFSRTQWIPAGYVGVIYDANSGLQDRILKPQAVFVGWRQQLYIYPTRLQNAVYTSDPTAGEVRASDGILVTTNDNANTAFDVSVVYRVKPEDVNRIFNAFGPIAIDQIQSLHIRRAVKEAANAVGTQYDLFALMGPKRREASERMTQELRRRLADKGLTVEVVMLGACQPSGNVQQKITSRVNSYVELEISRLKREISEIERQIAIVQGEADSQARALSAAQTKDRSIDLLRLQAAEEAIRKWDGQLPPISPKPGQTIVLTPDVLSRLGGQK